MYYADMNDNNEDSDTDSDESEDSDESKDTDRSEDSSDDNDDDNLRECDDIDQKDISDLMEKIKKRNKIILITKIMRLLLKRMCKNPLKTRQQKKKKTLMKMIFPKKRTQLKIEIYNY